MNETSAAADPGSMLLRLDDVSVRYGAILALEGISVGVRHGEIVAVMGPNGAGKSTVLKAPSTGSRSRSTRRPNQERARHRLACLRPRQGKARARRDPARSVQESDILTRVFLGKAAERPELE